MNLSAEEREQVVNELKRFASDLNLTDDQKEIRFYLVLKLLDLVADNQTQPRPPTSLDRLRVAPR